MRVCIRRFGGLRLAARCGRPERSGFVGQPVVRHHCSESSGLHPCSSVRVPRARTSGILHSETDGRFRSPFRSALHQRGFQGPALSDWLLRPRLTSRSALRRCPFRHQARSPQVRLRDLPCTTAGSTQWPFGRRGFAISCLLAPSHHALYPVPVRRLAVSLNASSRPRPHLAVTPLRFAYARCGLLTQKDFHLLVTRHAGRTNETDSGTIPSPLVIRTDWLALNARACGRSV